MHEKTYGVEALLAVLGEYAIAPHKEEHTWYVDFPCEASVEEPLVRYLIDEAGVWLSFLDGLTERQIKGMTGYGTDQLTKRHLTQSGRRVWGLQDNSPLLPFPFTLSQMIEFEDRAGGMCAERIYCGDETGDFIAGISERNPDAAEIARALVFGEMPVADEGEIAIPDRLMLATRHELVAAFGAFTGMDMSWFNNLRDTPGLLNARKVTGQGGRGHIREPLFCPFEVMQWLSDPKRKKGQKLGKDKAWELLERFFSKVYNAHSVGDTRSD